MKSVAAALIIFGMAAIFGGILQSRPYRLQTIYNPVDQAVLQHRDSVYSNITWVVSDAGNFQQMRFFDHVEGGIELRPSWPEFGEMAKRDPRLSHLVPADGNFGRQEPGANWPYQWTPNAGTLTNTGCFCLFPIGALLNERLMSEAGNDYRAARLKILVVGLGSGVGIGVLAHHFPQAEITAVDIDQVVIEMVLEHYPLLRWLTTQKNDAGRPRLRMAARDARQFIKFEARREAQTQAYNLVILDAFTTGSSIPPHLMTREFYAQVANVMDASGILMSNVIASYSGGKNLVLGGAIRSMRAAGFADIHNFPVLNIHHERPNSFSDAEERNNIVVACRESIGLVGADGITEAWKRLNNFLLYPELPTGTYVTNTVLLSHDSPERRRALTSTVAWETIELADASLIKNFSPDPDRSSFKCIANMTCRDPSTIERIAKIVLRDPAIGKAAVATGWNSSANAARLRRIDWVQYARDTFSASIAAAGNNGRHSAEALIGPAERMQREAQLRGARWKIANAPLFTDAMPNADIYNR